ncbi:hypothetical protein DY000_02031747 [Brassica cretica]|uniref:Uncharacterized protein n=1 Tax=Brassica cretica TaxID=69181 RepID=A0ABQ7DUJ7_BRACR|nr:hypothetical protein DY000_02031747 [Brassica cretica]
MKGDGLMLNDGTLCLRDGDITVSAELIKEMLSHGYAPSGGGKKAVSLFSDEYGFFTHPSTPNWRFCIRILHFKVIT